jgi:hypothetical protein
MFTVKIYCPVPSGSLKGKTWFYSQRCQVEPLLELGTKVRPSLPALPQTLQACHLGSQGCSDLGHRLLEGPEGSTGQRKDRASLSWCIQATYHISLEVETWLVAGAGLTPGDSLAVMGTPTDVAWILETQPCPENSHRSQCC